jgi:ABC-type multidrug transport system ATPase subunit
VATPTIADVLDVRHVSKSWPRAAVPTLQHLDLAVAPGSLVLVDGANGAGKTTLMRVIAGLIEPDEGYVKVCGVSSGEDRAHYQSMLGVTTAGYGGLYARLNARQHLAFSARLQFIQRNLRRERIEDAIARFDLGSFADRRVDRLSMGQRQRLRLGMAFLHQPAVVLLDEPGNSLDASGLAILEAAVESHLSENRGVVWFLPTGGVRPALDHQSFTLGHGALTAT